MKTFSKLLMALVVVLAAPVAFAVIDLRVGGTTKLPSANSGKLVMLSKTVDFTDDALTTSTLTQLFNIPANTLVLGVYAETITVEGTALTFDVGDVDDTDGYLNDFNANQTTTVGASTTGWAKKRVVSYTFHDTDTAASQSAAEWGILPGADVGGGIKGVPIPVGGSIIGVAVYSNAATTSGILTADVTVNGTATGLQAGLNSVDDTQTSYSTQAASTDLVTAGQRVGVKVTTDSVFAPTTADVIVTVFVETDEGTAASTAYAQGKYYSAAGVISATPSAQAIKGKVKFNVLATQF